MKNPLRIFFYVLISWSLASGLLSAMTQEPTEPRESVKILTIGNSFTQNATEYLSDLAETAGKDLLIFRANLGGASFERHANFLEPEDDPNAEPGTPYKNHPHPKTGERQDFSLREALQSADWDYVTIQQVSSRSFRPETFGPAHRLIAYIREHAPNAEILIHQTWTYRNDYSGYEKDDFSQQKMYDGLTAAYEGLAREYGLRLIPVGDAFHAAGQTAEWSYQKDPDFDFENPPAGLLPDQSGSLIVGYVLRGRDRSRLHFDFKHANTAGKYLGAAVWYEILFGEPLPADTPTPDGLTRTEAESLRRIAHQAVQKRTAN